MFGGSCRARAWRMRAWRWGSACDVCDRAGQPRRYGEICVLRAPAVRAGVCELRADRIYHRMVRAAPAEKSAVSAQWQDGTCEGLSDKRVLGFELDP